MTYAWSLGWILLNDRRQASSSSHTIAYLIMLLDQLTPAQQLYAEMAWADPVGVQ